MHCCIATVNEHMSFDHCCSKNVFTGELGPCRISSVRGYIRNRQGMDLPLGMVEELMVTHFTSAIQRSFLYIGVAEVVISSMPLM